MPNEYIIDFEYIFGAGLPLTIILIIEKSNILIIYPAITLKNIIT